MSALLILFLVISTLCVHSKSVTTYSAPLNQIHYVSSPNTRGTLDILWSCFFTIIACTWTIQHLNLPEQFNAQDTGWTGNLKWTVKSLWRNVKWMLATMIAPEYILGKALADLQAAVTSRREMKKYAQADGVEWELTHGFFANMGGFVLSQRRAEKPDYNISVVKREGTRMRPSVPEELEEGAMKRDDIEPPSGTADGLEASKPITPPTASQRWRQDESEDGHKNTVFAVSSTSTEHKVNNGYDSMHTLSRQEGVEREFGEWKYSTPFHLLASEILELRSSRYLVPLPNISTADLNDKSKDDMVIKLLAISQVFWFVLQVIVRAVNGLKISQLEIAVTAFAVCAIITYLLILPKPKGVQIPVTWMQFEPTIPIGRLRSLHRRQLQGYLRGLFGTREAIVNGVDVMGAPIPNDAVQPSRAILFLHFGVAIGGIIFGAIHISAWHFHFPTPMEQTLWRAASVLSTALLPVMYSALLVNEFIARMPQLLIKIWDIIFGGLYLAARLFLLVETFRTLFYLPPEAYVTTWATSLPHFS